MRTLIAIDPGRAGGLAWRTDAGDLGFKKCPESEQEMVDLLQLLPARPIYGKHALVEAQQGGSFAAKGKGCPVCHKPPISAKSQFNFGRNYGTWLGILAALQIPFQEIHPKTWQKAFGGLPKDSAKRKAEVHRRVQNRWPHLKPPKYIADALAILAVLIDRQTEAREYPMDTSLKPEQPELFGEEW